MITRPFAVLLLAAASLSAAQPEASPSPTPAPTPALSLRETINRLSEEEVAAAIQALKSGLLGGTQVTDGALQRATLEGLVRRFSPGASLVTSPTPASVTAIPFLSEILDARIGYVRPCALNATTLSDFDTAVAGFNAKGVTSIILDLRDVSEGDFDMAADLARRFCPKGRLLFSIQKPSAKQERIFTSNQDPAFTGVIVVLTDSDTKGAAEALAATLRLNAGAMIIGSDTAGEVAEFALTPVSNALALRLAVAQVNLSDKGPLYPGGVKPDVAVSLPPDIRDEIFRLTAEKGVTGFVFEAERRRLNEAALLSNQNPEIDSAQTAQRERGRQPPLRDTVLQRAVDLVTAIEFYRSKAK